MTMELDTILCGDSLNMLKALPESSVHSLKQAINSLFPSLNFLNFIKK